MRISARFPVLKMSENVWTLCTISRPTVKKKKTTPDKQQLGNTSDHLSRYTRVDRYFFFFFVGPQISIPTRSMLNLSFWRELPLLLQYYTTAEFTTSRLKSNASIEPYRRHIGTRAS